MGKPFFEVFPTLKLDAGVKDIMEQAEVERVSATKKQDLLRIYLFSSRLIMKNDIWRVENEIKKQLFPHMPMVIKIYERFTLSSQYTPERLMDIYGECLLEEVKQASRVTHNALKQAQFLYPTDTKMVVRLEDTVICRSKEEEISDILYKVLRERCGLDVIIEIDYMEAKTGKFAQDDAIRIEREVSAIYNRVRAAEKSDNAPMQETAGTAEDVNTKADKKSSDNVKPSASGAAPKRNSKGASLTKVAAQADRFADQIIRM